MASGKPATKFGIVMDGVNIASFSELQGIQTQVDVVDFMETTDGKVQIRKVPGNARPPTVTLKRGKDESMELWAWHEAAMHGQADLARRSCSLVMYSSDGDPVARYYLENAWVSRLEVSPSRAGSSDVLTETVTLVCESIQRVAA